MDGRTTPPGQLMPKCVLAPIGRISPSRFGTMQECALREVWRSAGTERLLPKSPRAWLGTIIHEMLQLAVQGRFNGATNIELGTVWESKVRDTEREMAKNWLEIQFVPLSRCVWDLQVQKIRTINKALELSWTDGPPSHEIEKRSSSTEVWIESSDHRIGGKIDVVTESQNELVLKDYKSGLIQVQEGEEFEINPEYVLQVDIYAGLYFEAYGRWPDAVELIPLVGPAVRMKIDKSRCQAVLQDAREAIKKVNGIVSGPGDVLSRTMKLATPSPRACKMCEFRPACPAYRQRNFAKPKVDWPCDIIGTVEGVKNLPNDTTTLTVVTGNTKWKVRGLSSRDSRHPAMPTILAGNSVGLFNLKPSRNEMELREGTATTVYQII
jgi:hypothetical protein